VIPNHVDSKGYLPVEENLETFTPRLMGGITKFGGSAARKPDQGL
jgi:hypothetical protein